MPWSHCEHEDLRDDEPCPGCGITKDAWTVEWEVTRTFAVKPTKFLKLKLCEEDGETSVGGEPYRVETVVEEGAGELVTEGELDDQGEARFKPPEVGEYVVLFPNRTHAEMRIETATGKVLGGRDSAAYVLRSGKTYRFRLGQLPWLITLDPEEDGEHVDGLRMVGEGAYDEVAPRNHALRVDDRLEFRFPEGTTGYYGLNVELQGDEHEYPVIDGLPMPTGRLEEADDDEDRATLEDQEIAPFKSLPLAADGGAHPFKSVCAPEEECEPEEGPRLEFLEVEDVTFHTDSAVLMPERLEARDGEVEGGAAGLVAIDALLRYVQRFPERVVLVAGHADASGSRTHNLELSRLRAENVLAYLRGDKDAWVASASDRHRTEDVQQILKFVAGLRGWPCDPGDVDGDFGRLTRGALGRFRARVAGREDDDPPRGPDDFTADDWQTVFDSYEQQLGALLGCSHEQLSGYRERLVFFEPAAVGCGEGIPAGYWRARQSGAAAPAQRNGSSSQADRRVELLLFEPGEEPDLSGCHRDSECDQAACELYGSDRYRPEPMPVGATEVFTIKLKNEVDQPIPEAEYVAVLADGTEVQGVLTLDGTAKLLRPPGRTVVVSYPDPDDVLAKSEAGHARVALENRDRKALRPVLQYAPETSQRIAEVYERYFNDLSGEGLVADIEATFEGDDADVLEVLLVLAGLEPSSGATLVEDEDDA